MAQFIWGIGWQLYNAIIPNYLLYLSVGPNSKGFWLKNGWQYTSLAMVDILQPIMELSLIFQKQKDFDIGIVQVLRVINNNKW